MTCIVGVVHDGAVYMGGDSCGSSGTHAGSSWRALSLLWRMGEAARASLYTTQHRITDPVQRVRLALEAAEAVVTTVRPPHRVWRLEGGQVEEV